MRSMRFIIFLFVLITNAAIWPGCAGPPRLLPDERPAPVLRITHHVGGRHERMLIHAGLWYQTFGGELLVLELPDGSIIARTAPGPTRGPIRGHFRGLGAATDMVIHGERLLLLIEDDGIAELSLADPRRPVVTDFIGAARLGVRPRRLSIAEGEVYVSGAGGIVQLNTGDVVFQQDDDVGRVVTSNWGLVTTVGRRIYRLRDGEYIGSASELLPLPVGTALPGSLAFIRRGDETTSIGLMHGDLREVDAHKATVQIDSPVHRVRIFNDRIWIITEEEIRAYVMRGDELKIAAIITVQGARDVQVIDDNHLAIAGTFGRGIWRLREDESGPGRQWSHLHREPSALTWARFDGRQVLTGGQHGAWLYALESGARPVEEDAGEARAPMRRAVAVGATARIENDGERVMIATSEGRSGYGESDGSGLSCIAAVDGRFWIGHDRGITVLQGGARDPAAVLGRLRLDGPVRFIFPLLEGGGAAWVSEFGGLGVARFGEPR